MESARPQENKTAMEPMLVYVFITDIREQAGIAVSAAGAINAESQRMQDADGNERLWFAIRALLTAAASISKALWPNPRRKTAKAFPDRGRILRERLEVADDSPLADRDLRNHFEHLDERLEEWWLQDTTRNIARRTVGPFETTIVGLDDRSMFEQFDPSTFQVAFRGDVYELQPLVTAIDEIKVRADAITTKPWWTDEPKDCAEYCRGNLRFSSKAEQCCRADQRRSAPAARREAR